MPQTVPTVAAIAATSRALPSIKSPAPAAGAAVGPQSFFYQTITIPTGARYPVQVKGNYVYVEGITYDTTQLANVTSGLTLRTDSGQTPVAIVEPYREIFFPQEFGFVELYNSTGYTVFLTLFAGFGAARRDFGPRLINSNQSFSQTIGGAFAANDNLTGSAVVFVAATNPNTQRSRIKKASLVKSTTTVTGADFTLWLFTKTFTQAENAPFQFLPTGLSSWDYVAQIRFPQFVVGGAGTSALCDVGDLDLAVYSAARDPNGYANGTLYGALVTNAAYTPAAAESYFLNLTLET